MSTNPIPSNVSLFIYSYIMCVKKLTIKFGVILSSSQESFNSLKTFYILI